MQILISEPLQEKYLSQIQGLAHIDYMPDGYQHPEELHHRISQTEVLVTRYKTPVTESLLLSAPKLKYIFVFGLGLGHLHFDPCDYPELEIVRCHDENADSVAEFSLNQALNILKRNPEVLSSVASQKWDREHLTGTELKGKQVTVFGLGSIGKRVARLYAHFGARVRIVRQTENQPIPLELWNLGIRQVSATDGLRWGDIVSVHISAGPSNRNFFDRSSFRLLKPHAIFINASRGSVVHTHDLLEALERGEFGWAALDVLHEEPPTTFPKHPRLTITPHIAGVTTEAVHRVHQSTMAKLKDLILGKTPVQEPLFRPSHYLIRVPESGKRTLVGRAFSREKALLSNATASLLFDKEQVQRSVFMQKAQEKDAALLWKKAIRFRWLVPEGASESDITELAREEMLEDEVGTNGLWDMTGEFFVRFLQRQGLRPDHHLLDVGCGNLRVGLRLIPFLRAGHYTGFDRRSLVIEQGQEAVEMKQLQTRNPQLLVTDNFLHPGTQGKLFDYITLFQVLYHLEDWEVEEALGRLKSQLIPGGRILGNVQLSPKLTDKTRGKWKEFPFLTRTLSEYQALAKLNGLVAQNLGTLTKWGYDERHLGATNHMLMFSRPEF